MNALTLPHGRRLQGASLGLIWIGMILGSWVAAYFVARLIIWAARALLS